MRTQTLIEKYRLSEWQDTIPAEQARILARESDEEEEQRAIERSKRATKAVMAMIASGEAKKAV